LGKNSKFFLKNLIKISSLIESLNTYWLVSYFLVNFAKVQIYYFSHFLVNHQKLFTLFSLANHYEK